MSGVCVCVFVRERVHVIECVYSDDLVKRKQEKHV